MILKNGQIYQLLAYVFRISIQRYNNLSHHLTGQSIKVGKYVNWRIYRESHNYALSPHILTFERFGGVKRDLA